MQFYFSDSLSLDFVPTFSWYILYKFSLNLSFPDAINEILAEGLVNVSIDNGFPLSPIMFPPSSLNIAV